jgi:hypothetical protein
MTQMGGVVVEVSLKVAATKSSVTMQLKKICDTCVSARVGVGVGVGDGVGIGLGLGLGLGVGVGVAVGLGLG